MIGCNLTLTTWLVLPLSLVALLMKLSSRTKEEKMKGRGENKMHRCYLWRDASCPACSLDSTCDTCYHTKSFVSEYFIWKVVGVPQPIKVRACPVRHPPKMLLIRSALATSLKGFYLDKLFGLHLLNKAKINTDLGDMQPKERLRLQLRVYAITIKR